MPSLVGHKLDKYDMLEEVGHGGMAVVYRGEDSVLRREVAVKVLHSHLADREESRLRLQREAIAVAKLRHENILEIFDYSGPEAGESYIVTEFIHGPTLREWIDDRLEPRPAIAALVVHRLSMALCHAHRGGIVHRDIKPENVMIRKDDGCIKLMDFGIAQILDNQKLTLTGQLIGSPAYMAPELISGKPLDARTDLFSLGILLYQLATGALPFSGRNPHEVLNRIADGDYPAPSTLCPLVDRDLEAIIAQALATNPEDRFQSVEALAKELENYLLEIGIEASTDELGAYFNDPEAYVVELDERVSVQLMKQADEASRAGQSARAIRLLGRVLEIDADHKKARGLLARLRQRERRMRQALLGAGALAISGLVGAGFMLAPESTVQKAKIASTYPWAFPAADEVVLPANGAAAKDDAGSEAPQPPAPDDAGEPGAEAGDTKDVTPTGPDAATPPKPPRKPPPPRVPVETACTVKFSGPPVPSLPNLHFTVAGQRHDITGQTMSIKFPGAAATLVIKDAGYTASKKLDRPSCEGGVVAVPVKSPKAFLVFNNGPAELAIKCVSGCPDDLKRQEWWRVEDFPRFGAAATGQKMTLQLKAEGFHPRKKTLNVVPGRNPVNAQLTEL